MLVPIDVFLQIPDLDLGAPQISEDRAPTFQEGLEQQQQQQQTIINELIRTRVIAQVNAIIPQ
jgi:hypothetical protein